MDLDRLHQLDHYTPSDHRCGSLKAWERDVIFRTKQAINCGPAALEQCCHLHLGYFPFLDGLCRLPHINLSVYGWSMFRLTRAYWLLFVCVESPFGHFIGNKT